MTEQTGMIDLSDRQLEALEYAAAGLTNPEVGARMGVTMSTATSHLVKAHARLGALNTTHAVAIAVATGLIKTEHNGRPCSLRDRQRETLELMAGGLTQPEVGRKLFIATSTVAKHLYAARKKMGALNTTHAVAIAVATGLIGTEAVFENQVSSCIQRGSYGALPPLAGQG